MPALRAGSDAMDVRGRAGSRWPAAAIGRPVAYSGRKPADFSSALPWATSSAM